MSKTPLSPEREAAAQQLATLLREATTDEFLQLARLFVTRDEAHTFGQTEFDARDILFRAGAKAFQTFLDQKKTATGGPV
jgi:hypothetical protein